MGDDARNLDPGACAGHHLAAQVDRPDDADGRQLDTAAGLEMEIVRLAALIFEAGDRANAAVLLGDDTAAAAETHAMASMAFAITAVNIRLDEHRGKREPGSAARFQAKSGKRPWLQFLQLPPTATEESVQKKRGENDGN